MWKKLRDSTSGINFSFISNLFHKRNYSKFDSKDELVQSLHGSCDEELRDEENNKIKVNWTDSVNTNVRRRRCGGVENSFKNEDLFTSSDTTSYQQYNTDSRSVSVNADFNDSYQRYTADVSENDVTIINTNDASDDSNGYGADLCDGGESRQYEFYAARSNGYRQSVKDDIQDFVNSCVQMRYEKLDDSDNDSDIVEFGLIHNDGNGSSQWRSDSCETSNNVFHSIKDITPTWENKPTKKKKKRRKIGKRVRRGGRVTWKWLRRGFMGYASNLSSATKFFVIQPTNLFS